MVSPQTFVRDVQRDAFWRELVPWLHVGATHELVHPHSARPPRAGREGGCGELDPEGVPGTGAPALPHTTGYLHLPALVQPAAAEALARALLTLRANAVHPTFVYVYDETWELLDALRPWLDRSLGGSCEVLADAWAFCVDPRTDRGGWPIHRGWYEPVRTGSGDPGLVNVWVSLSEADARNACMHLVPLARDPHYPANLDDLSGLADEGTPIPTQAGSVLVWDANVAHWGGSCDPTCERPRLSVTFTARRAGTRWSDIPVVRPPLAFPDRLDLIARQLVTYGAAELDPGRPEMRWAAMVDAMGAALRLPRPPRPPPPG